MINQEMLKTMQFIVEQQAQFATNMQRFEERQVKAEERAGVEERMTKIENVMLRLANVPGEKRMEDSRKTCVGFQRRKGKPPNA